MCIKLYGVVVGQKFVNHLNIDKADFKWLLWPWEMVQGQMVGIWQKVMRYMIICHTEMNHLDYSFWIVLDTLSHCYTWGKRNLPNKIKKVGHCDLIQNLVKVIPLGCLHIPYGPCNYYGLHLPGQSLQTENDIYIQTPMYINGRHLDLLWSQCRSQWPTPMHVGRP